MEIFYAILLFLFYCFISFTITYSCDRAKIWGNLHERPPIRMPSFRDIEEEIEEKRHKDWNWSLMDALQQYTDKAISPAAKYFSLLYEIEKYQDTNVSDSFAFFVHLFFIGITAYILTISETISSLVLSFIIVAIIFLPVSFLISIAYEKYWRFNNLRLLDFVYSNRFENISYELRYGEDKAHKVQLNNSFILAHYEYLFKIRDSVIFRHNARKIFGVVSFILYIILGVAISTLAE